MTSVAQSIGASIPRIEAPDKAAGTARYVDDLTLPGMLHAAILQSPHAHARILSYDVSRAKAVPGVRAVVTGADIPGLRSGGMLKDETMLAVGKVRYVGEPVAAVAARDAETAERAARLIDIAYEPLPSVLSIDEALASSAPLLHEELGKYVSAMNGNSRGNVIWESVLSEGNVDNVWAQCDVIVEAEYETQAQQHAYLETNGVLADVEHSGRLRIIASCQSVHHVQTRVAEELGIPMSQVRAQVARVGGGFGGKHATGIHSIAAYLARVTSRPVKLVLSRTMDMEIQKSRHPARIRLKTGAKNDGTIIARDAEITLDGGAYADESPNVLAFCMLMVRGPYSIPHVRIRGRAIYTNKLRAGSFRGFGNPQATFAGESQIDELALRLKRDPFDMRIQNAMKSGERWIGGQVVPSCQLRECLVRVHDASKSAPALSPPRPGHRRGIGVAAVTHISGLMGTSASVQLRGDGSVAVNTGCVDIGQGSDTTMAQLCAAILGLPLERIAYSTQDSDLSPYNWKTAGSRSTYMTGRAVVAASEIVRQKILEHAAEILECAASDLELRPGGKVGLVGVPGKELSFKDVAFRSMFRTGGPIAGYHGFVFDGPRFDPKRAVVESLAFDNLGVYTFGAQCVEVDVDEETGQVKVLRAWSAHDVGRAVNFGSCKSQIQGGFVQGLGYALTEQLVWDDDGRLANPSLADYKVPGVLDVPAEIVPIILEDPDATGPFGAKGVGEISLVGVAPAIANAVAAATGARIRRLPLSPERTLGALEQGTQF